jgi:hypothetical protein
MKYLTSVDPNTGRNPVEVYMEKQTAWAKAQDAWDQAKIQARSITEGYALAHDPQMLIDSQSTLKRRTPETMRPLYRPTMTGPSHTIDE